MSLYTKSTRGQADSNRQGFGQVRKVGLNMLVVKHRQRDAGIVEKTKTFKRKKNNQTNKTEEQGLNNLW